MISDAERHDVARRLRCDLEHAKSRGHYCNDSETVKYICSLLGLRCSKCSHPWAGLEALADIIEPAPERTCHYVYDNEICAWRCSECGGLEPVGDHVRYCPDCGARIAEEVRDAD